MSSSAAWRASLVALVGVLAACNAPVPIDPGGGGGGTPTPLVIDSTFPASNALLAPYGQPVYAYTDSALQTSTATVTSVGLVTDTDGFDVPRQILVQNGNRIQATASLLPGTKYRETISMALKSTNGGVLPAPYTWTFTTRTMASFTLATGNGFFGHLSLAKDSTGGLHAVYADSVNGDLAYAECASSCALAANWAVLALDLDSVGTGAIGVDASGRVHVVFRSDRLQALRYATCLTACTSLISWSFAVADSSSSLIGINPSIAVTPGGAVYATYYDGINKFLRFARCLALCTLQTNWANGTPDTGPFVGQSSSIVVDGAIRHVVYQDSGGRNLKYATCIAGECLQPADWTISAVSLADGGQAPAMVLGPNHLLAVTYYASTAGGMKYASCATICTIIANWTTIDLTTTGLVGQGSGLTVDVNGRVQAAFIDNGLDRLRYATCSGVCTTASRWRYSTIQQGIGAARSPTVVPSKDGGLDVLYLATDGTAVNFAE